MNEWIQVQVATDQCLMQYAANAVSHARFLLNRPKEGRYIAGTATNQDQDSEIET